MKSVYDTLMQNVEKVFLFPANSLPDHLYVQEGQREHSVKVVRDLVGDTGAIEKNEPNLCRLTIRLSEEAVTKLCEKFQSKMGRELRWSPWYI